MQPAPRRIATLADAARAALRADWTRVLGAVTVGAVLFVGLLVLDAPAGLRTRGWPLLGLDLLLGLTGVLLLPLRRRWPVGTALVIAALSAFSVSVAGAVFVAFVSLCARERWPKAVLVGIVMGTGSMWWEDSNTDSYDPQAPWFTILVAQVCFAVSSAIVGVAIRGWRRNGRPPLFGEIWRVLAPALPGIALLLALTPAEDLQAGLMGSSQMLPAWWWSVDLSLASVSCALILLRRTYPLPVMLTVAAITVVSLSSTGALLLVFISLCARRFWQEIVVGSVALLLSIGIGDYLARGTSAGAEDTASRLIFSGLLLAAAIAIGLAIGSRRAYIHALQERAETAEREQSSRVAEARATERARIAREMHDVLAHRISLIAMHSGALAYREDLPVEQTREIAGLLRDNADHAVQELRAVLGVLRGVDQSQPGDDTLRPQPTLEHLDALISEATSSGTTVDLDRHRLSTDPPPETISRTGYRIIQESLTNARKHAPGATVTIVLSGDEASGLSLEIRTPAARQAVTNHTGSGMGLVGLTERAVLAGGRFSYGVDRAERFVVRAWLPWTP